MTRILHAPTDTTGYAYNLSRAERRLGLESDVAIFAPGPYGYDYDYNIDAGLDQPVWKRLVRRARFLRKAIREYDVFHFNFGQGLFPIKFMGVTADELVFLRRAGKKIVLSFHGCDVRPQASCFCSTRACAVTDRYRVPNARRMLRHADKAFYLNPDLRFWLPGASFLAPTSVDLESVVPQPFVERGELVVAHAPTHREYKGTVHVIAAIKQLQAEGLPIRLDLIEKTPHDEVLRRTAGADIVVDQVMIGWFGVFAVEAMAMAKPTMNYIIEGRPGDNPYGDDLPLVRTSPQTLARDIRALAENPERRRELGVLGRAFVEREFDPLPAARHVLEGLVELPAPSAEPQSALI